MINNKKGVALLVVMSIVLALFILGSAAGLVSTGHFGTSFAQIRRARAYYAAEAGIQHALWRLRTGQTALPSAGNADNTIQLPEQINGIPVGDIAITVEDENEPGEDPEGVHPVTVRVTY
jgi:Tfp pilus assembly protein PilX